MKKSLRLSHVLEIIGALGKASPKDIQGRLAVRLGADQDEAFQRAVYRDLKELGDDGRVLVKAFTPDGEELSPEKWDETKHFRLEYSLVASDSEQIPGWKILDESGMQLITANKSMGWKAKLGAQTEVAGHFSLFIQGKASRWVALQLPIDQLPAKIIFARSGDQLANPRVLKEQTGEVFGLRAALLLTSEPTMSRNEPGRKPGHAVLTLTSNGEIKLKDFGSSNGTFTAATSERTIDDLVGNDSTRTQQIDSPLTKVSWAPLSTGEQTLSNPAFVRLGSFTIALILKPL